MIVISHLCMSTRELNLYLTRSPSGPQWIQAVLARVSTKEAFQAAMISQFGTLFRAWREAGRSQDDVRKEGVIFYLDFKLQGLDPTGRDRLSWGEFTHVFRLPGTQT